MPFENNNLINQIQSSLDILDIVREKVKLRRAGRSYMGLCPFHNEKTPSFHVYPDTQSYYCFGCHNGGNIFSFVMKSEGLDFKQALELLARRAGIEITYSNSKRRSKNLYDVTDLAAEFFTNNLKSQQGSFARAYMQRRKLDEHDIQNFILGFSPMSWDALCLYLNDKGISQRQIIDAGLAIENQNHIYDRFRGRLMFPVKDITGRVIAFGGRLIDGEGAKYINSPETEIFSKKNNLYLLYEARNTMRNKSRSILVEGYMDALRLHKCGFKESVASLGTSLTEEQAKLLARFSDTCYICYDSDTAGQNAALRGMYILRAAGLDVRIVNIPEGKDPDEFLSSNPPEKFEDALRNARPLVLKHLDIVQNMLNNPAKYKAGVKSLFEGLSKLDAREIMNYSNQICAALMISPDELKRRLMKNSNSNLNNSTVIQNVQVQNSQLQSQTQVNELEAGFCAMLWNYPEFLREITSEEIFKLLRTPQARKIALAILTEGVETLKARWLEIGDTVSINFIATGEAYCASIKTQDVKSKWPVIIKAIKHENISSEIKSIKLKMLRGQASASDLKNLENLTSLYAAI